MRTGLALENHSSEEPGHCESVRDPVVEDFIMKGPQLTEHRPRLHGALSVAGLMAAQCFLTQAWGLFSLWASNYKLFQLPFHHTQSRLLE